MERKQLRGKAVLVSAICGLLSLLTVFLAVPSLPKPCPDPVWMALDILGPVAVAILLMGRSIPAVWVWLGLPVQYGLLFLFSEPISRLWGMSLEGGGGFAFLFIAGVWPALVTLVQFLALLLYQKRRG